MFAETALELRPTGMHLLADLQTTGVILVIALFAGAAIAISIGLHRRRRTIWKRFARRHRLSCTVEGEVVRVTGQLRDRSFALVVSQESSDTGEFGVEEVIMRLQLHDVPAGLRLETTVVHSALAAPDDARHEGDSELSDTLEGIDASDPQAAVEYLTLDRRERLRRLAERSDTDRVRVADGYLCLCAREAYSGLEQLEDRLGDLLDAAPTFDANHP